MMTISQPRPIDSDRINDEKLRLISELRAARQRHIAALRDLDEWVVLPAGNGWRVQDHFSHLAAWEREVLAAIQAHSAGEIYTLGEEFDQDRFNATVYEKSATHFPEQARIGWGMVRRDLQFAIHDVPPDRFLEPVAYPWGGRGTVSGLVDFLLDHEATHVQEILAALSSDARPTRE